MNFKCNVCGDDIHFVKVEGKHLAVKCPYYDYKEVQLFLSEELKYMNMRMDTVYDGSKKSLEHLKKLIPDKTPLTENRLNTIIIKGTLRTFYLHLLRFLIDTYIKEKYSFSESIESSGYMEFSYIYATPDLIKGCYFPQKDSKFKSMTDLKIPSLVCYPLGLTSAVYMKDLGAMVEEMISLRYSTGRPTWVILTKPLNECDEITTRENLRLLLSNGDFPALILDESEIDPESFSKPDLSVIKKNVKNNVKKVLVPSTGKSIHDYY